MKQIVATTIVAFIGIIVLAQEAQMSGVSPSGVRNSTHNNSTQNSTHNNSAILDAVVKHLADIQAQINQLTQIVGFLQNSTHNHNSTHNNSTGSNNSTGNGNHNSTLIPGHNSTLNNGTSTGNFTQLYQLNLNHTRQLNSLQNSVNYLTGLLLNLTQHFNLTGSSNHTVVHLHQLNNTSSNSSNHHNSTANQTHHVGIRQLFKPVFLN